MTLFGQKIPPELLIPTPSFNGFYANQSTFADGLIMFAIISAMKKPWEYPD